MKKILFLFLFFPVLLTSCRQEEQSFLFPPELQPLLRDAAAGSTSELYSLGRQGGEGAWFALAAAAEDAGFKALSRNLQVLSAENDAEPFGTRSLSLLLIEDPAALAKALKVLRKAEKLHGPDEGLRQARIAVLASKGKERALADEFENFRGESWEAAVLGAVLRREEAGPELTAILERYILHVGDPSVLLLLPGESKDVLSPAYRRLLEGRTSGSRLPSLEAFRDWLTSSTVARETCSLELIPPVFTEMADAARETGLEGEWAQILSDSASKLSGSRRYGASYQAGRLYRELGAYREASSAFLIAAGAVPRGLDRDRAMWFRLKVMYEDYSLTLEEELEVFSWTAGYWDDADRFDDFLEEFIHRRVRRGEWSILEETYRNRASFWPDGVRSQAAWILAFAAWEGRLNGETTTRDYLETAFEAAPWNWSGLRAAGLLNRGLPPVLPIPPEPRETAADEPGEDDLIIRLFLKWGLNRLSVDRVLNENNLYNDETIRRTAEALADEYPRVSIRIAGLLWRDNDYQPSREDLLLRYPLPYGTLTSDTAMEKGLPPELLLGLVRTESAWDAKAVSRSGAEGLAQFMPSTWEEWVGRLRLPEDSDPMDPELNLTLAAAYLEWLYLREWTFGWQDVLASYNAGGGRLRGWKRDRPGLGEDLFGMSIPIEEPRSYIRKVLSAATIYGYLYADKSPRVLHKEWNLEVIPVIQAIEVN